MSFTAPDVPPADPATPPVADPAPTPPAPDPTSTVPDAPQAPAPEPTPPVAAPPAPVQPVRVDGTNRRDDNDGLEGGFVEVVAGEFKGLLGSFISVEKTDPATGYPEIIIVRARDHAGDHDLVSVAYADCRPVLGYHGGR